MSIKLVKDTINFDDVSNLIEWLKTNPRLTKGNLTVEFEKKWSEWLGVKYSVFVNSGASANLLTMAILKIRHPEGGEVIVPPLTWISDVASVLQNGFTPVFVDIDPQSLAMDPKAIFLLNPRSPRHWQIRKPEGYPWMRSQ